MGHVASALFSKDQQDEQQDKNKFHGDHLLAASEEMRRPGQCALPNRDRVGDLREVGRVQGQPERVTQSGAGRLFSRRARVCQSSPPAR